ncbi:MAG: hypothetical protein K2L51_02235, partial [Clostridiales bacterium]|nr:hypothetical protein [Clostridiales bacterium]
MKKETKKDIQAYVFSTLMLYGFSLLFSLLSLIFIIDKIPDWLKCVVSFVFMAPVFYLAYIQGKSHGEKLFKARAKTTLSDIHSEEGFELPYYRC